MLLLYIVAYLDRINVSFAGLQMNQDLGFDEKAFGAGAGAFFLGYFLFGVPSNVMVKRLGARRWIAAIMVVWGAISASMSLVKDVNSFYFMRFILGVAEAGFFPGMILYLTYWFPKKDHAQAVARFMTAIPLAGVLGGLISSRILLMNGVMGLPGWKWLFIITGSPAILLGIAVFIFLSDGPQDCKWLKQDEKQWLQERIARDNQVASEIDEKQAASRNSEGIWSVFASLRVWHLALLYFCLTFGMYGFQLWLPQIIKNFDKTDDSTAALLSAVPAVFQAVGMILVANSSDRRKERRFHVLASSLISGLALLSCGFSPNPLLSLSLLCIAAFGIWGTVGPFWALPTSYLNPEARAAGIALINSVGNLGGYWGPYIVGFIKSYSSDFIYSLATLAASLVVAGLLALFVSDRRSSDQLS